MQNDKQERVAAAFFDRHYIAAGYLRGFLPMRRRSLLSAAREVELSKVREGEQQTHLATRIGVKIHILKRQQSRERERRSKTYLSASAAAPHRHLTWN